MLTFLKNHPFAVKAFFEHSLVITYAVAKDELKPLVPECLDLDTYDDKWGFVAVAFVSTRRLRPAAFPGFLGNDFFLAGYRIFVRYKTREGKRLRGLFILKSETNKKQMAVLGNMFTHYNYNVTDIDLKKRNSRMTISSNASALNIEVALKEEESNLPERSPFNSWKEARHFAGPLPFTFTYNSATKDVLIIEGSRKKWLPQPVEIIKADVGFIKEKKFNNVVLANAFLVESIPYHWKKGRMDKWTK
jgi:hypothetical protein